MKKLIFVLCLLCIAMFGADAAFAASGATGSGKISLPVDKPLPFSSPAATEFTQQFQALVTGGETAELEPQDTFGTRALGVVMAFIELVRAECLSFVNNFAAIPQAYVWFVTQLKDQRTQDHWLLIGELILTVIGGALAIGAMLYFSLSPLRHALTRREPFTAWGRAEVLFLWLLLAVLPVCAFLGAALLFLNQSAPPKFERYVVMNVVYAFALQNLVGVVSRFLLAPRAPNLRLMPIESSQAIYLHRWVGGFAFVMILGYFFVDLAHIIRMPQAAITAFTNLLGLIVVVMAITVITQKRALVSMMLRGELSAANPNLSLWQSLRLWLARTWHVLAIAYLVIGSFVTMLGAGNQLAYMQRGTILTLLTLIAMWLASYLTNRMGLRLRREGPVATSGIYRPVLQGLLRLATWILGVAGIAAAWGVDVVGLMGTPWGQRVMGSAFSITSTLVIVVVIYEFLHAAIERHLNPRDAGGKVVEVNSRARTLLPMLRNAAIIVLAVIVGLVTLSELGINIAPLLAGAGVIGVAVGFGSQTLVKDFLTGLFIILEDTIALGDVVSIGDHSGTVDSMALRTIRLRDDRGAVHILPYSEITKVVNMTKNFSFAVIDIRVAYKSDLEQVMEVMRDIGKDLRQDAVLGEFILEDLQVLGVENFGDSAIVLRCKIKTKPGKQWEVKRAFLLRVKSRFDREEIEIPYTAMTLLNKPAAASSE